MRVSDMFSVDRDLCHVCGQTPCNCTHITESAYSDGVSDGMRGEPNRRASSIYGPESGEYQRGYNDGVKRGKEEQEKRIAQGAMDRAPYEEMSDEELINLRRQIQKRTRERQAIYTKLRGADYSFDFKRHTPPNHAELKQQGEQDNKAWHIINGVLQSRGINIDRLGEGVADGNNVGDTIRSLYQKIYDQGDDALEYLNTSAPLFSQFWDQYEGDLDSIIAELSPKNLIRIAKELQSVVNQEGVAEESEKNPFTNALGHALYRDLSKFKKASPAQVKRNEIRWAQRQKAKAEQPPTMGMSQKDKVEKGWAHPDTLKKKGVAEGLEDGTVQQAIIDTVERLFHKNNINDYGSLEAVRQGVRHHFSKPEATVEYAIDGILNILNKRMRKSGNYVDLGRFKEALRQGIDHQFKKQGVAEGLADTQQKIVDTINKLENRLKHAKTPEQWDRISARIDRLQAGLNRSKQGVAEGKPGFDGTDAAGRPVDQELVRRQEKYWNQAAKEKKQQELKRSKELKKQGVAEGSASSHSELARLAHEAYIAAVRQGNAPMANHYKQAYEKHKRLAASERKSAAKGVAEGSQPNDIAVYHHTGSDAETKAKRHAMKLGSEYGHFKHDMADKNDNLHVVTQKRYFPAYAKQQGVAEVSDKTLTSYLTKVDADSQKHEKDPTKRSPEKRNKSVAGFARAFNKLDARKEKSAADHLVDSFTQELNELTGIKLSEDQEVQRLLHYARAHYPNSRDDQEAFMKYVFHALRHSEEDDMNQNKQIGLLKHQVDSLQNQQPEQLGDSKLDELNFFKTAPAAPKKFVSRVGTLPGQQDLTYSKQGERYTLHQEGESYQLLKDGQVVKTFNAPERDVQKWMEEQGFFLIKAPMTPTKASSLGGPNWYKEGATEEEEADYGNEYQDMVKRMAKKAADQELDKGPVDIADLARKLRSLGQEKPGQD